LPHKYCSLITHISKTCLMNTHCTYEMDVSWPAQALAKC
jgi:hypothetical protein